MKPCWMSRSKENTTSSLEIPKFCPKRPESRPLSSGQDAPDQAMPGQYYQPHCLNPGLLSSLTGRTDHLSLLRTFVRSSRTAPSSNDPLSLPPRSIILRPTCHQCCPGSVSCRINFGIGCFPLPLLVSAGLSGSRWRSILGGLGRRTVGGRGSPLSPVTGDSSLCGEPRMGSEKLTFLAGVADLAISSTGLLGGARGSGLMALDMLMRLRGSNSSSE
jgi:hypothetical protein